MAAKEGKLQKMNGPSELFTVSLVQTCPSISVAGQSPA